RLRIDVDDVARLWRAAGQSLALADGEHLDAVVRAEERAGFVVNAAGMKLAFAQVRAQKRLVVIARHETNLLAVHFVRYLQPKRARDFANLRLRHFAERAERVPELRLAQAEKKIGLILARIAALAQHR